MGKNPKYPADKTGLPWEGSTKQFAMAVATIETGSRNGAYDWREGIAEGKSFKELNPEQQAQLIQDTRDNTLDPTKGYRLLMAVEPSYDAQNSNSFVKVEGAFSTYWAVNPEKTVVLAGKIAAGSIFGVSL